MQILNSAISKILHPVALILGTSVLAITISATMASPAQAHELQAVAAVSEQAVSVKDYDVFVDLPTAFAFIKLPAGWKFIGKLDAEQLRRLPAGTLTALLQPEDGPARQTVMVAKANVGPALK